MLYGARISLAVGLGVVLMASVFGTLIGMVAGYLGGWWDEAIMRVTDIFFAFPSLILAMAIAGALGPSLRNALIAVAAVSWPSMRVWCAGRCWCCASATLCRPRSPSARGTA